MPYVPKGHWLLRAVKAVQDYPDTLYAEDVTELKEIGGESLTVCNVCKSEWASEFAEPTEKLLFTTVFSKWVKVYDRKCTNPSCSNLLPFQGLAQGYINCLEGVFELAMMYRMRQDELDHGLSIHALRKQIKRNYLSIYCPPIVLQTEYRIVPTVPTWEVLRDSLYFFKRLMRLDYAGGFRCELCHGDVLVFDGVTFGPPKSFTAADPTQAATNATVIPGSKSERLYVTGTETRSLLKRFAGSGLASDEECDQMLRGLSNRPQLKHFITMLMTNRRAEPPQGRYYRSADRYVDLIKNLAALSPVAAIVHPTAFELVDIMLANGTWSKNQAELAADVLPILTKHIPCSAAGWPDEVRPVVAEMRRLAAAAFNMTIEEKRQREAAGIDIARAPVRIAADDCKMFAEDGSWAPRKGALREVPFYQGVDHVSRTETAGGKDHCTKEGFSGRNYLVSGVFQCTCPHGAVHGFCILRKSESSVTLTKFLVRHWGKAPSWIFYDDACHAYTSALLREPDFFMESRFCVDRFHWNDHKACSDAFNPSMYEHMAQANTSVAEQFHAKLQKIRGQTASMRLGNFMEYVRHFSYVNNVKTGHVYVQQMQLK